MVQKQEDPQYKDCQQSPLLQGVWSSLVKKKSRLSRNTFYKLRLIRRRQISQITYNSKKNNFRSKFCLKVFDWIQCLAVHILEFTTAQLCTAAIFFMVWFILSSSTPEKRLRIRRTCIYNALYDTLNAYRIHDNLKTIFSLYIHVTIDSPSVRFLNM